MPKRSPLLGIQSGLAGFCRWVHGAGGGGGGPEGLDLTFDIGIVPTGYTVSGAQLNNNGLANNVWAFGVIKDPLPITGKWYWEVHLSGDVNNAYVGLVDGLHKGDGDDTSADTGLFNNGMGWWENGGVNIDGSNQTVAGGLDWDASGDQVLQFSWDAEMQIMQVGLGGTFSSTEFQRLFGIRGAHIAVNLRQTTGQAIVVTDAASFAQTPPREFLPLGEALKPTARVEYPATDDGVLNWWDASTNMEGTGSEFELLDIAAGKKLIPVNGFDDVVQTTANGLAAMELRNLDGIVGIEALSFPASWMLIMAMDVRDASNTFSGSIGLSDGANGRQFYLRPRPPENHQMLHQQIQTASGGFAQGPQGPASDVYDTGSMHVFALVFNADTNTFGVVVDQELLGVISYGNDWDNLHDGALYIGGQNQGARPVDLVMGEAILTRSVDTTTRAAYENYLATKWGVTLP
jgi:hypothetical protein